MTVTPDSDQVVHFADDFPTLTHPQWQDLVAKVMNRGRPEDRLFDGPAAEAALRTRTVDGIEIDPLYRPEGDPAPTGHPGVMPFTRGTGLRSPDQPWDVRGLYDDPDPKVTARDVLTDLQRGVTSVWLEVGPDAVHADDVPAVLADVLLDLAPVVVTSERDQHAAAQALLDVWADRGVGGDQARGRLGYDPLGHMARTGEAPEYGPVAAAVRHCLGHLPQVRALTIDTRVYHDAGAGDVDELGCAIATAVAYVRALEESGVPAADTFAQLNFRVSATTDQFCTIARLRALRRLWARVGEVCGVPVHLRGARQSAVTSRRMMTRDDPWVNILRGTVATFGAAVGGAEAVTVLPFDTVWGHPTPFSRRIARNTQLLLAEESNVGRVIDPAGGSTYVEHLTDRMARAAWESLQRIEAAGGMAEALASGLVADRIAATAAERDSRLARRALPLTGVSMFPKFDEAPLDRRPRPVRERPGGPGVLPARRDSEVFERLRDRSAAHEARTGARPSIPLLCIGARRDFGARETFTSSFLAVAGIAAPLVEGADVDELTAGLAEHDTKVAFLCSSPKVYAQRGAEVARAAREAGVTTLYIAGKPKELRGEGSEGIDSPESLVDGGIAMGCDVVDTLQTLLAALGVAEGEPA